jgi:hypothetical protein
LVVRACADRRVLLIQDLPKWLIHLIAATEMDPKFALLDA